MITEIWNKICGGRSIKIIYHRDKASEVIRTKGFGRLKYNFDVFKRCLSERALICQSEWAWIDGSGNPTFDGFNCSPLVTTRINQPISEQGSKGQKQVAIGQPIKSSNIFKQVTKDPNVV